MPAPVALNVVLWIGLITSLLAALMATQQDDIKRILAYSTLSQLGLMVAALGLGVPVAALFHLFTHAFFKALLFLGAGSVIHQSASRAEHLADGRVAEEHAGHVLDLSDRNLGAGRLSALGWILE